VGFPGKLIGIGDVLRLTPAARSEMGT